MPRQSSWTRSTGSCARGAGCSIAPTAACCWSAGPEAAEYLQGQLTNDIEALAPGEGCYAALLDRKGHMQADMRVLRPARPRALARHRARARRGRPAPPRDLQDRPRGRGRGRGARAGDPLADRPGDRRRGGHAPPPPPRLRNDHRLRRRVPGRRQRGRDRPDRRRGRRDRLRAALLEAGAAEVDAAAAEILRIEAGRPRFGAEMSTETMPAEAGIVERAVSFTKGCYIGQEPVARLHHRGRPNRHLRGLRLSAPVERRRRPHARRQRGRPGGQRLRLPGARADRPGDHPSRGRARGRADRR